MKMCRSDASDAGYTPVSDMVTFIIAGLGVFGIASKSQVTGQLNRYVLCNAPAALKELIISLRFKGNHPLLLSQNQLM
jgi:hypothetical protein